MDDRPTIGEIAACSAFAAMIGGALSAALFGFSVGWESGLLDASRIALFAVPFGVIAAIGTAMPVGFVIGVLISRSLGWGYLHAALAGGLTALALGFFVGLPLIAPWPDSMPVLLLMFYGMALGAIGWRIVMRPGGLRYQG